MLDKLLKTMGLSYTTRYHLRERFRRTDWLFLVAVAALILGAGFVLFLLA